MPRSIKFRALAIAAATILLAAASSPASAHDPWDGGAVPPPPPASPADGYSGNMHLLSTAVHTGGVNSDLAFSGNLVFAGHYGGFRVLDISDPGEPVEVADVHCNGPQGDVSVWGGLLFLSVDTPQSTPGCEDSRNVDATTPGAWEGIRVFDISNPAAPQFLQAIRTDCGSHTHSLVPKADGGVYVYNASYPLSSSGIGPDCHAPFERMSIIDVPGADRAAGLAARVVAEPTLTGIDLYPGPSGDFFGCHDIQVLTPRKIASAACMSQGQLWDISNPVAPRVIANIDSENVDIWHGSAFTPDGKYVTFGDEYFGPAMAPYGSIWTYAVDDPSTPLSNYQIPRDEFQTYHNFNYVPVADRNILVAAAYGSGTSVVDLTDPTAPREIAHYDMRSSQWSTYWYNGFIVANDISRGVDLLRLSTRETAGAKHLPMLNPQTQTYILD